GGKKTQQILRKSNWLLASLLIASLCFTANTIAQNAIGTPASKTQIEKAVSAEQLLEQIAALEIQLDELKTNLGSELKHAQAANAENLAALEQRQTLAEQFIFNGKTRSNLQDKTQQGAVKLKQKASKEALTLLKPVAERYRQLIAQYALIDSTIEAQKRAELTRTDSKMYYEMRVRSALPAKALKAYGIMELAKQQRDKGQFSEALTLWEQAETLVRESFNEHIAAMAKWREDALKDAEIQREKSRVKVEALLNESMQQIPAGEFLMGSTQESVDETPVHKVHINAFKLSSTEVTFELYDLCVASSNCFYVPPDEGWGKGARPVTNISFHDITNQFLPWLNKLTGREYRLPSEAEWEYTARAGTSSEYFWGQNVACGQARFDGGSSSACATKEGKNAGTVPVKSFKPNAFGLFDMHGNVWEWVEDCWHANYDGAPTDGSAWVDGNCDIRVLRGGAWDYPSNGMRSANRYYFAHKIRKNNYGFRLALTIKP
ncbi:MAG TPA: formylglycine-generating enzyme family protein, partial [Cellvibrionaceae bacterium]